MKRYMIFDKDQQTLRDDLALLPSGEIVLYRITDKFESLPESRFTIVSDVGFKYKNGRLIFEGDILSWEFGYAIVDYHNGAVLLRFANSAIEIDASRVILAAKRAGSIFTRKRLIFHHYSQETLLNLSKKYGVKFD